MFTRIMLIGAALILPAAAAAQRGSRVRVRPQCQNVCPPVTGTIDRFLPDSVRLRDERTRALVTLPLSVMASAEIPNGRGSNIGVGIVMGAMVGLLSAIVMERTGTDDVEWFSPNLDGRAWILGGALGVTLGVAIGINGGKERWIPATNSARLAPNRPGR